MNEKDHPINSTPPSPHPPRPSWHFITRHPAHFIAFGFGSGLSPWAPGTVGSLLALPLYGLLLYCGMTSHQIAWLCLPLFVLGVYVNHVAERALQIHDHGGTNIDEIVAMLWLLAWIPLHWQAWLTALLLFRFFDIIKPWPISWLDSRVKGGFGTMIDDIAAALLSWVVFFLLQGTL